MKRHDIVLKKLIEIEDEEWLLIMEKCKRLIDFRTAGRTKYGCHSEIELGCSPFDFYFTKAVEKLYSGAWDWNFEKYNLGEQLCRILQSIISESVRIYESRKKRTEDKELLITNIYYTDEDQSLEEKELQFQERINLIESSIQDDHQLKQIFQSIKVGKTSSEICAELNIEKKKYYKLTEKLRRIVLSKIKEETDE